MIIICYGKCLDEHAPYVGWFLLSFFWTIASLSVSRENHGDPNVEMVQECKQIPMIWFPVRKLLQPIVFFVHRSLVSGLCRIKHLQTLDLRSDLQHASDNLMSSFVRARHGHRSCSDRLATRFVSLNHPISRYYTQFSTHAQTLVGTRVACWCRNRRRPPKLQKQQQQQQHLPQRISWKSDVQVCNSMLSLGSGGQQSWSSATASLPASINAASASTTTHPATHASAHPTSSHTCSPNDRPTSCTSRTNHSFPSHSCTNCRKAAAASAATSTTTCAASWKAGPTTGTTTQAATHAATYAASSAATTSVTSSTVQLACLKSLPRGLCCIQVVSLSSRKHYISWQIHLHIQDDAPSDMKRFVNPFYRL